MATCTEKPYRENAAPTGFDNQFEDELWREIYVAMAVRYPATTGDEAAGWADGAVRRYRLRASQSHNEVERTLWGKTYTKMVVGYATMSGDEAAGWADGAVRRYRLRVAA